MNTRINNPTILEFVKFNLYFKSFVFQEKNQIWQREFIVEIKVLLFFFFLIFLCVNQY